MGFEVRISVIVENSVYQPGLKAEHGWSVLIETETQTILFDTGQSDVFINNAQKLNIDLNKVNKVVLSHGHYDHTGGLEAFLSRNSTAVVYAHPDSRKKRYSFSKILNPREIGMPDNTLKFINRFNLTKNSLELSPGCFTTGEIPRVYDNSELVNAFYDDHDGKKPDLIFDDQAIFLDTPKGPAVVLGCCHAGLANTFERVKKLTGKNEIYMVMGGMHLSGASENYLNETIQVLREYNVKKIGAAHCTGLRGLLALDKSFPGMVFPCSVGTVLHL